MVTNLQLYWNAKAFGSEDLITLIHQFEAIDNQLRLLALVSSYRNHSLKQLKTHFPLFSFPPQSKHNQRSGLVATYSILLIILPVYSPCMAIYIDGFPGAWLHFRRARVGVRV